MQFQRLPLLVFHQDLPEVVLVGIVSFGGLVNAHLGAVDFENLCMRDYISCRLC